MTQQFVDSAPRQQVGERPVRVVRVHEPLSPIHERLILPLELFATQVSVHRKTRDQREGRLETF